MTQSRGKDQSTSQLTFDKVAIIRELIDVYATRMISPNIAFHTEFYKKIQEMHSCKSDGDIMKKYTFIKHMKVHNIKYEYQKDIKRYFIPEYVDASSSTDTVMRIVGGSNVTIHQVMHSLFDQIESEEVCQVLNYIYTMLLTGGNCIHVGYVVAWLLRQPHKTMFVKQQRSSENDIIQILFGLCIQVASKLGEDFDTFSMISRDLYYYKASKKHSREHRMGILYMLIFVIVTRKLEHDLQKPIDDIKSKYMFVICHKDTEYIHEVYADRVRNHALCVRNPLKKRLNIEDSVYPQRKDATDIVKM